MFFWDVYTYYNSSTVLFLYYKCTKGHIFKRRHFIIIYIPCIFDKFDTPVIMVIELYTYITLKYVLCIFTCKQNGVY